MVKVHFARSTRGVGPADRTGKSLTVCWPGGTRELLSGSRRRPLKPREMKANDQPPEEPAWFTEKYGGARPSRPPPGCELDRGEAGRRGARPPPGRGRRHPPPRPAPDPAPAPNAWGCGAPRKRRT